MIDRDRSVMRTGEVAATLGLSPQQVRDLADATGHMRLEPVGRNRAGHALYAAADVDDIAAALRLAAR